MKSLYSEYLPEVVLGKESAKFLDNRCKEEMLKGKKEKILGWKWTSLLHAC